MKSKGIRRKSRKILRKKPRERGMQPLGRLLHKYKSGEKVVIKIDPSIHGGMPHPRYHGKVGVITDERGKAFIVELKDYKKTRELIVGREHLIPYSNGGGN